MRQIHGAPLAMKTEQEATCAGLPAWTLTVKDFAIFPNCTFGNVAVSPAMLTGAMIQNQRLPKLLLSKLLLLTCLILALRLLRNGKAVLVHCVALVTIIEPLLEPIIELMPEL